MQHNVDTSRHCHAHYERIIASAPPRLPQAGEGSVFAQYEPCDDGKVLMTFGEGDVELVLAGAGRGGAFAGRVAGDVALAT